MKHTFQFKRMSLKAVFAALLILALTFTAGAYYEAVYSLKGSTNIEINLLFDNLSGAAKTAYQDTLGGEASLSESEKTWGHIGNPYVINNVQHVRNLHFLQERGFFENQFPDLVQKPAGGYTRDSIPYFLVCTKDGKHTAVDCGGMALNPIGNDAHPFYGSIKGYGTDNAQIGGTTYPGSAIHNLKIEADSGSNIDVGLFSKIGCLGYQRTNSTEKDEFNGIPSVLENIIFSDVQIVANNNASALGRLHTWLIDLFAEKPQGTDQQPLDPAESNHLGILAGHVEYADIKNISVYYSAPEINAIDLNGQGGNFVCTTGFFGLLDNMNPKAGAGANTVVRNSGDFSSNFLDGTDGDGGLVAGIKPGYLRAQEIYEKYDGTPGENGRKIIKDMKAADGTPLTKAVKERGNSPTKYYFRDSVFTFALSEYSNDDCIEDIWPVAAKTQAYQEFALEMLQPGSLETAPETTAPTVPQTTAATAAPAVPETTGAATAPAVPETTGAATAPTIPETTGAATVPTVPETTTATVPETTEPAVLEPVPVILLCSPENMDLQIWTLNEQEEKQFYLSVEEEKQQEQARKLASEKNISLEAALAALPRQTAQREREYNLVPGVYCFSASAADYVNQQEETLLVLEADPTQADFAPQKIEITLEQQVPETTAAQETVPGTTAATTVPETTAATTAATTVPETTASTDPTTPPTETSIAETIAAVLETIPSKASAMLLPEKDLLGLAAETASVPTETGLSTEPTVTAAAEPVVTVLTNAAAATTEATTTATTEATTTSTTETTAELGTVSAETSQTVLPQTNGPVLAPGQLGAPKEPKALGNMVFYCTPENATVTMTRGYNATPVDPVSKNPYSFNVDNTWAKYHYEVTAEGYTPFSGQISKDISGNPTPSSPITVVLKEKAKTITYNKVPADLILTVTDQDGGSILDAGSLTSGTYLYTAIPAEKDQNAYYEKNGQFTVTFSPDAQSVDIHLDPRPQSVTFEPDPAAAEIQVKQNGQVVQPVSPGKYMLLPGSYTYSAACVGYTPSTDQAFTVEIGKSQTVQPKLEPLPMYQVTVPCEPKDLTLTVRDAQGNEAFPVATEPHRRYSLPDGTYTYEAVHSSGNYYKLSGSFTVSGADLEVPAVTLIPIPLRQVQFLGDPAELPDQGMTLLVCEGTAEQWSADKAIPSVAGQPCRYELKAGDPAGTSRTYSARASCPGYLDGEIITFEVADTDALQEFTVKLQKAQTVTFHCDPGDLTLEIYSGQNKQGKRYPAEPETGAERTVQLPEGIPCYYTAEKMAYIPWKDREITAAAGMQPVEIQLQLAPKQEVQFTGTLPQDKNCVIHVRPGPQDKWGSQQDIQASDPARHLYALQEGTYYYQVTCFGYADSPILELRIGAPVDTVQEVPVATPEQAQKISVLFHCEPSDTVIHVTDPNGKDCPADQGDGHRFSLYPGKYTYRATSAQTGWYKETQGQFEITNATKEIKINLDKVLPEDPDFPRAPADPVAPPPVPSIEKTIPDIILSKKWTVDTVGAEGAIYRTYLQAIPAGSNYRFRADERYFLRPVFPPDQQQNMVKFMSLWQTASEANPTEGAIPLKEPTDLTNFKVSDNGNQIVLEFSDPAKRLQTFREFGIQLTPEGGGYAISQTYRPTGAAADRTTYLGTRQQVLNVFLQRGDASHKKAWGISQYQETPFWDFNFEHGWPIWAHLNLNGNAVNVQTEKNNNIRFQIYRVVRQDSTSTKVGYQAVADDNGVLLDPFPADRYVLKAVKEPNGGFKKDVFELVSYRELGWTMAGGTELGGGDNSQLDDKYYTPTKLFNIHAVASWGAGIDFIGLSPKIGGLIRAPIMGSVEKECFIPTGCLAFHVNELKPEDRATVRVIIKIPAAARADAPVENRIGIWKGTSETKKFLGIHYTTMNFNKNNPTSQNVITPISKPRIDPNTDISTLPKPVDPAGNPDFIKVVRKTNPRVDKDAEYGTSPEKFDEYYTTLQGETYLMAAEFDLKQINTTGGGNFIVAESEKPLQIVYCAADGVASSTRDGGKGSALGTIDFVYDNGSASPMVIPVTYSPAGPQMEETMDNYKTHYFPSNLLLRFNNMPREAETAAQLPDINQETLSVYRYLSSGSGEIEFETARAKGWTGLQGRDVQILGGYGKNDHVTKK